MMRDELITVYLNIGLADSETGHARMSGAHRLTVALATLSGIAYCGAVTVRLCESLTERTAAVFFTVGEDGPSSVDAVGRFIYNLAAALGQDAIAAIINGEGSLIGPCSAQWGEFDISRFEPVFKGG